MTSQRVALIGAGDWAASALAPALAGLADVQIVACVDSDLVRAETLARAYGIETVLLSADELVQRGLALDVVVISTPDRHHVEAFEAAVAMGAAVYCEKPLALSGAEAQSLVGLTASYQRPSTVGFNFRYSQAVQQLKADLDGGVLGEPWLIETQERNSQFHPESGRAMTWKGDPRHASGGALLEYGAHILDLDCWLVGRPVEVSGRFLRVAPRSQLDDVAILQLVHDRGVLGTLAASWVLAGGFPGIRVVVHGSRGTGEVMLDDGQAVAETYRRHDLTGRLAEAVDYPPVPRHTYAQRHLADLLAVAAGDAPRYRGTLPSVQQASEVQALLDRVVGRPSQTPGLA